MSDFDRLMIELVARNTNLYKGEENATLPTENITCYYIPGIIGSLVNGKRQANMLITLDSISDDKERAYNNIMEIQEEILQNTDYYDSKGFEFRMDAIENIEDISFIEANQFLYRYKFSIEVFYFREVV